MAAGPTSRSRASWPASGSSLPRSRARYDIITFDPRGFGYSTAVRCFPTTVAENQFLAGLPPFPVGARQDTAWERTWARFDARCAAQGGSLLDHDTTADVARDMNLLREAVGAPVLNYIGLSYGTGLGATYANLFPATTGHMILDGNLNPVTWTHADGGLPIWLRQHSDQGLAASMQAFLDLCGKTTTSACAFSAGTPAATRAQVGHAAATPAPASGDYRQSAADLHLCRCGGLRAAGHCEPVAVRRQPAAATVDVLDCRPPGCCGSPATPGHAPPPASAAAAPPVYTGEEQTLAVLCSDSPNPRDPGAYPAAARRAYARSGGFGRWKHGTTRHAQTGRPPRPRTAMRARGTDPRPAPSWSSATPATPSCPTWTRSRCPATWPTPGC